MAEVAVLVMLEQAAAQAAAAQVEILVVVHQVLALLGLQILAAEAVEMVEMEVQVLADLA
jgi:hypothetical protein